MGTATAQVLEEQLVRLDAPGPTVLPDGVGEGVQISPDGQWTLFRSSATNLATLPGLTEPGPTNLFLRDGRDGSYIAVNQGPGGELLSLGSWHAMVSRGPVDVVQMTAYQVGRHDIEPLFVVEQ